jgi:hypothetical protein
MNEWDWSCTQCADYVNKLRSEIKSFNYNLKEAIKKAEELAKGYNSEAVPARLLNIFRELLEEEEKP